MKHSILIPSLAAISSFLFAQQLYSEEMNELWGEQTAKLRAENAKRGQLFNDGNYAMFVHWGLYSNLANEVGGKTYYGIGEWIMSKHMANIPVEDYKKLAHGFNPTKWDAKAIAKLAKDAGMKYVIITSKHHDGFAMYNSKCNNFNIVKTTPWRKDPMKELAKACRAEGLGFGFYYSHNQDWTFPGGNNGPSTDTEGKHASFDDYFNKKCLPQVEEITTQYGPIELVWFDTPGSMPRHYAQKLVDVVRKNQPKALVSGRVGHNLGDYRTMGDMEVPHHNHSGMWESVDTTNDSWGFAAYDQNWKSPKSILRRLIACVGRGGTYMLNIGPRGDGSIPQRAADSLRSSGKWIKKYPQVIYGTEPSPWQHALPWGDVTAKGNKLYLTVFDWPTNGYLYLPGLQSKIKSAKLLNGSDTQSIRHSKLNSWTVFDVPVSAPEKLASVIELELASSPKVDHTFGLDPNTGVEILAEFSHVQNARLSRKSWMEKFGEWKDTRHVHGWQDGSTATFEINVQKAGDYQTHLTYSGNGRLVWGVAVEGGQSIKNQQAASQNYQEFPMGWIHFPKPGKYKIAVSCLEGDRNSASLKAIRLQPITK